jgi:hypothetical protein
VPTSPSPPPYSDHCPSHAPTCPHNAQPPNPTRVSPDLEAPAFAAAGVARID